MTKANEKQFGGDHYKQMGEYEVWDVLQAWLTPAEWRGYMKGNVIRYLARERGKGGNVDLQKAGHYIEKVLEAVPKPVEPEDGKLQVQEGFASDVAVNMATEHPCKVSEPEEEKAERKVPRYTKTEIKNDSHKLLNELLKKNAEDAASYFGKRPLPSARLAKLDLHRAIDELDDETVNFLHNSHILWPL